MKFTHRRMKGDLVDKQRECGSCGHVDRVFIREEVVAVLEVQRRVFNHTQHAPQTKESGYHGNGDET